MAMEFLDISNLQAFGDAAAGHVGVLSDKDGTMVAKPCTDAEIKFYTQVSASLPELAIHIPQFMGTIQLAKEEIASDQKENAGLGGNTTDLNQVLNDNVGQLFGSRKIPSETAIVLGNVAKGFQRPNILDIKLGARLWDEKADQNKRARLDKVAGETTTGSLGFRIAGMRVWNGLAKTPYQIDPAKPGAEHVTFESKTGYRVYNRYYGRAYTKDTVVDGILEAMEVSEGGVTIEYAISILQQIEEIVDDIRISLEGVETRMISSSLLIVYEGDPKAAEVALTEYLSNQEKKEEERKARRESQGKKPNTELGKKLGEEEEDSDDYEDDSDADDFDDDEVGKTVEVKLIDFAHASVVPGKGPDENVLHGVRNVISVLQSAIKKLQKA